MAGADPLASTWAEEAWLARHPDRPATDSVHLTLFPIVPASWRDDALAARWARIRDLRRVVTGALEVARADKRIGASLQAHPLVHIADPSDRDLLSSLDMAEVCITSDLKLSEARATEGAFTLPDVPGVATVVNLASGEKCGRCWRVGLDEVGTEPAHVDPVHPLRRRRLDPDRGRLMAPTARRKIYRIALATSVAIGLIADQASKWALIGLMASHLDQKITLLPVFDLVMWWNHGTSFSMFTTGSAAGPYIFPLASLAIVGLLVLWLSWIASPILAVAIGAVIGGALGNVVDRLRFGAVADFFYAHIGELGWPAFNVADSLIVVGVAILVLDGMFVSRGKSGGMARREGP